jgi:hypothetical protein
LPELYESSLVDQGLDQAVAHQAALEFYSVNEFQLYDPEVILANPSVFGTGFKQYYYLGQ